MIGDTNNKRVLNISEAAKYTGYSRGSIEFWIREGMLSYESPPSQGVGRQHRKFIRKEDLDRFLNDYYCYKYGLQEDKIMNFKRTEVTLLPRIN